MGKGKLWLLILACLAFIAAGGWIFSAYWSGDEVFIYGIIGVICMLFFGICLIYFILKLFDRAPGLILNEEGIVDNSSYIAGGLIRWKDIHNIELYQLAGQKMIGIQLKDPDSYLRSQKGIKRRLISINQGMVQAPVNIAQSALRMPLEQIYEEMFHRWHWQQKSRLSE